MGTKPNHGVKITPDEFANGLKVRLGVPVVLEPEPCCACTRGTIGPGAARAFCCGRAQATIGHNNVTDIVRAAAHVIDPAATTETRELIHSAPGLRPADILTSTVGATHLTTVDIEIASPDAAHAGSDCLATMYRDKTSHYGLPLEALQQQAFGTNQ